MMRIQANKDMSIRLMLMSRRLGSRDNTLRRQRDSKIDSRGKQCIDHLPFGSDIARMDKRDSPLSLFALTKRGEIIRSSSDLNHTASHLLLHCCMCQMDKGGTILGLD